MSQSKVVPILVFVAVVSFVAGLAVARGQVRAQSQKELPSASAEDFKAHVLHYPDLPTVELAKGSNSRLVVGEQSMISFLKMDAHSYFPPHHHKAEQIMTVMKGYCDEIIEGKLYRLKEGDTVILPSNIEHGAYIRDQDCIVIDVFGEVRGDYLMKMQQSMAGRGMK
jgi:quercetin dioxygenase-like cupin family protein